MPRRAHTAFHGELLVDGQPVDLPARPADSVHVFETNWGSQPVSVQVVPADFTVSQNGSPIWQSSPGVSAKAATTEILQPGQSISQTATWDGTTSYVVNGSTQGQVNNFGTFSVSSSNGLAGQTATFLIANPVTVSFTTDQAVYQLGEPVTVTFTATNTSSSSVTTSVPADAAFDIDQNGTPLWTASYPQTSSGTITLAAGQTYTATQTLSVIPSSGFYRLSNLTGTFEATYGPESDPAQYTTAFEVDAPSTTSLVTSIAAAKSTYLAGQPVVLTLTEKNDGTAPVSILTGPNTFSITNNGSVSWYVITPGSTTQSPTWTTLLPGQSYAQNVTWYGPILASPSDSIGKFTVSNNLDPNPDKGTFQIVPVVSPSLSAAHASYKVGSTVHLTMTLKNNSTTKIALAHKSGDGITILDGSTVVFRSAGLSPALAGKIIKPGASLKLALNWSGKPNQKAIKKLSPGTYTIEAVEDGYSAMATIRIVAAG